MNQGTRREIRDVLYDEELGWKTRRARIKEKKRMKDLETHPRSTNLYVGDRLCLNAIDGQVPPGEPNFPDGPVLVNSKISQVLKPHQVIGVEFLWNHINSEVGCILADYMGLGKTIQVISLIDTFLSLQTRTANPRVSTRKNSQQPQLPQTIQPKYNTTLVVAPMICVKNWMAEFQKWLPSDRRKLTKIFLLESTTHKTIKDRALVLKKWRTQGGVLLIGYELYRNLILLLKCPDDVAENAKKPTPIEVQYLEEAFRCLCDPGPDLAVLDEAHRLRNRKSKLVKAFSFIKTTRRILLTGYPLQNHLAEYWTMVDFARPWYLGNYSEFMQSFGDPIKNGLCQDSDYQDVQLSKKRSYVLTFILQNLVLRRDQAILKKSLPARKEWVLMCKLSQIQFDIYRAFLRFMNDKISKSENPKEQRGKNVLGAFHVSLSVSNHPDIPYRILQEDERKDGQKKRSKKKQDSDGNLNPMHQFATLRSDDDEIGSGQDDDGSSSLDEFVVNDDAEIEYFSSDEEDGKKLKKKKRRKLQRKKSQKKKDDDSSSSSEEEKYRPKKEEEVVDIQIPDGEYCSDDNDDVKIIGSSSAFLAGQHQLGFAKPFYADETYEKEKMETSGKMMVLFEILKVCTQVGDRVIVFSQSLKTLDVISNFIYLHNEQAYKTRNRRRMKPYKFLRIDGTTPQQTRFMYIQRFNDPNEDLDLVLVSTKAAGEGVNLIGGNRIVMFDVCWNPSHDHQSMCRSYRYGQKKPVHIYRLISSSSMERTIYRLQLFKEGTSKKIVDKTPLERKILQDELGDYFCEQAFRASQNKAVVTPEEIKHHQIQLQELLSRVSDDDDDEMDIHDKNVPTQNIKGENQEHVQGQVKPEEKCPMPTPVVPEGHEDENLDRSSVLKDQVLSQVLRRVSCYLADYYQQETMFQEDQAEACSAEEQKEAMADYENQQTLAEARGQANGEMNPEEDMDGISFEGPQAAPGVLHNSASPLHKLLLAQQRANANSSTSPFRMNQQHPAYVRAKGGDGPHTTKGLPQYIVPRRSNTSTPLRVIPSHLISTNRSSPYTPVVVTPPRSSSSSRRTFGEFSSSHHHHPSAAASPPVTLNVSQPGPGPMIRGRRLQGHRILLIRRGLLDADELMAKAKQCGATFEIEMGSGATTVVSKWTDEKLLKWFKLTAFEPHVERKTLEWLREEVQASFEEGMV